MKGPDISGQRFSRLTVLHRIPSDAKGNSKWLCRCDCGRETTPLGQSLRSGATTSCGCYASERASSAGTHHASGTTDYKAWHSMVQRCTNPNRHKWHRYGGRGIVVCDRWLSYENFLADMGPRPPGMTIERKNNDGNYEPDNCCWATQKEQARNRSTNVFVVVDGVSMTASDASRRLGSNRSTVGRRIREGWSPEAAINTPLQYTSRN